MNYRESGSIQAQRMMLRQYAAEHGLTVVTSTLTTDGEGQISSVQVSKRMIDDRRRKNNCVVIKGTYPVLEETIS